MALGYDGTIKIDTSIDSKGMAKGTKSISSSLGGVMRALKGFAALMGIAFSAVAIGNFVKSSVSSFNLLGTSFGSTIKRLTDSFALFKSALANSVMAALNALAPYIIIAVNWLTKLLTVIAQVVTALFGVSTGMSTVADATGDAGKSAKGALAGFDQLNVLSKDAGADAGGSILPPVTVPPEILAQVEEFKTKMLEFLQPVIDAFGRLKESLEPLGKTIWEALEWAWKNIIKPFGEWVANDLLPAFFDLLGAAALVLNEALIALKPLGLWLWEEFLQPLAEWTGQVIIDALGFLTEKLNQLSVWIKENPEKFQNFVIVVLALAAAWWLANAAVAAWVTLSGLGAVATAAFGAAIAFLTSPVFLVFLAIVALIAIVAFLATHWEDVWKFIVGYVEWAWGNLKSIIGLFSTYFDWAWNNLKNIVKFILDVIIGYAEWAWGNLTKGVEGIGTVFENVFTGIKNFVKGIINSIIGFINGMIDNIVGGINSIVGAANLIGNIIPGYSPIPFLDAPQIPQLATGAVIPPNAKFAAILGDQKSGTNIEAPAALIRQIVSEEMGKIEANIKIEFGGSLGALVRELKPLIDKENVRVGGSLIKSGVTI
jgi:hypothetical protein